MGCALCAHPVLGDTAAAWNTDAGGDWATASNWSTNPNYPNNGTPSGTDYAATIAATGSQFYGVTIDSNITVDSLTLNSNKVQVTQSSGTVDLGTANFTSGGYFLTGGSLNNTTINSSSNFFIDGGTLNGDTLNGTA